MGILSPRIDILLQDIRIPQIGAYPRDEITETIFHQDPVEQGFVVASTDAFIGGNGDRVVNDQVADLVQIPDVLHVQRHDQVVFLDRIGRERPECQFVPGVAKTPADQGLPIVLPGKQYLPFPLTEHVSEISPGGIQVEFPQVILQVVQLGFQGIGHRPVFRPFRDLVVFIVPTGST
jgi:hypothetical protein